MVIPYDVMYKIYKFVYDNNIQNNIQQQTVFEEYILGTLVAFYTNKKVLSLCKVYWNNINMEPSTNNDIDNQEESCFKRLSRKYNDERRKWLRDINNYYTIEN
jgi:hypothetical protein